MNFCNQLLFSEVPINRDIMRSRILFGLEFGVISALLISDYETPSTYLHSNILYDSGRIQFMMPESAFLIDIIKLWQR